MVDVKIKDSVVEWALEAALSWASKQRKQRQATMGYGVCGFGVWDYDSKAGRGCRAIMWGTFEEGVGWVGGGLWSVAHCRNCIGIWCCGTQSMSSWTCKTWGCSWKFYLCVWMPECTRPSTAFHTAHFKQWTVNGWDKKCLKGKISGGRWGVVES